MPVAVDADLVPSPQRFAHEVGASPRDPAEKEDGRAVPAFLEEVEKDGECRLDPGRKRVPPPPVGVVVLAADVEPVLGVDREDTRSAAGGAEEGDLGLWHGPGILVAAREGKLYGRVGRSGKVRAPRRLGQASLAHGRTGVSRSGARVTS